MPANGEGKLIAYKWRKSAILETPEQKFFCRSETHAAHLASPLTPTWGKSGKMTPPPENFSARGSSSSFSPFTLKCPNSSFLETSFENFLKLLRTSINRQSQGIDEPIAYLWVEYDLRDSVFSDEEDDSAYGDMLCVGIDSQRVYDWQSFVPQSIAISTVAE